MGTVITFGTFDLFHIGHLRVLQRAAEYGDRLVVGISTDEFSLNKKGHPPIVDYASRAEIVGSLRAVDAVFPEHSLEAKPEYIASWRADVLVMGDDWVRAFDWLGSICEVVYVPRTPMISTTLLKVEICDTYQAPNGSPRFRPAEAASDQLFDREVRQIP